MRRVLYISYYFAPMIGGGVHRVMQTCKYLPQFGWAPTALTPRFTAGPDMNHELLDELPEEVRVERTYCPLMRAGKPNLPNRRSGAAGMLRAAKRWSSRFFFLPDWQIVWYPWAVSAGRRLIEANRFDAILATYTPATNLLVGARLAKDSGLPLVLDFRDIWADNPTPVWATRWHQKRCQRMERRIVRRAAKVIGVSEPMVRHLASRHELADERAVCITNGFDPADVNRARDDRTMDTGARPFQITFTGSVYGATDLSPLFQAVADMARDGEITPASLKLQFVGNMTIDQPRELGIEAYVDVSPPVPHKQVFDYYAASDALLLVEMQGYHARYSYVSKLFDYMLAGKPIVALADESEMTAAVVHSLGGRVVEPGSPGAIRRAIGELLAAGPAAQRPVDIAQEPWRSFDRRRLTERMAGVLDSVVDAPQAAPVVESNTA